MSNALAKIKRLEEEDIVWYIYFFLIAANLYSNQLSEKNIINKNINTSSKIKNIDVTVLLIALIIYLFFVYQNYQILKENKTMSSKTFLLNQLNILASILFVIGGGIVLYTAINKDITEDIAI